MPNDIYYGKNLDGVTINAVGVGNTQATLDARGYTEVDTTDTDLVNALGGQGAHIVDVEGTEEALTAGTIQTATTLSALVFRNGAGASVINVYDLSTAGTLVFGPITIAANAERVIVFPEQIPATVFANGVFIDVDSGALNATPGFLIP